MGDAPINKNASQAVTSLVRRIVGRAALQWPYVGVIVIAAAFAAFASANGIPALRHDWAWPRTRPEAVALLFNHFGGWSSQGLGTPLSYPTDFITAWILLIASAIVTPIAAFVLFCFVIGLVIAGASLRLSRAVNGSSAAALALALFVCFNPWTYAELVAGHTYMLLAYGGLLGLGATVIDDEASTKEVLMWLLCVFAQPQFYALSFPLVVFRAWRRRDYLPLAAYAAVALPTAVGIICNRDALLSIPFSLAWESSQSVQMLRALELRGYFAQYDAQASVAVIAGAIIFALAVPLSIVLVRSPRLRYLSAAAAILAAGFALFSAGTVGPAGLVVDSAFTHVHALALFRELYDLVGIVALLYGVCAVIVMASIPKATYAYSIAALLTASQWIAMPPSTWWLNANAIPHANIRCGGGRYALIPWRQPLRFNGRGSGLDPDALSPCLNMNVLNVDLPLYPIDKAFAEEAVGNASALGALGVSHVLERRYLSTDAAVNIQGALRLAPPTITHVVQPDPIPRMALTVAPVTTGVADDVQRAEVFYGDLPARDFSVFQSSASSATREWVPASLVFLSRPDLSEGLGGVATASKTLFRLDGVTHMLVNVTGSLVTDTGRMVSKSTAGYEWIAVPSGTRAIRCIGLCVLVGSGAPDGAPQVTAPVLTRANTKRLDRTQVLPWLMIVRLPQDARGAMRFASQYSKNWVALYHWRPLRHFRYATALNGWFLPAQMGASTIVVLNWSAALQALLELAACVFVIILFARRTQIADRYQEKGPLHRTEASSVVR